jgi:hypothetical protein
MSLELIKEVKNFLSQKFEMKDLKADVILNIVDSEFPST